jgi:hypothetical protein
MKNGWKEVARLGSGDGSYPHVLVDAHGWCLRLGRARGQERYYSNLPSLLQGLIEQLTRLRLRHCPVLANASAMLAEVRAALNEAATYRGSLVALTVKESSQRPLEPLNVASPVLNLFPPAEAA